MQWPRRWVCAGTMAGFEGQAAIELEALATAHFSQQADFAYPYAERPDLISWSPLWSAILEDLRQGVSVGVMAARFHQCLASAIAATASRLCDQHALGTVVLSGGVFQNRLLLERSSELLRSQGLEVLSPIAAPANDGGLSLGQAAAGVALCQHGMSSH